MTVTGFHFFDFIKPKETGTTVSVEVTCKELFEAAQEYQIRELAFWSCVNLVANALGRCEFRTFRGHEERREDDYYLWNVEPNVNQNSSAFLHKLVAKLYQDNEVLIINPRQHDGRDTFVVADSWDLPERAVTRQNKYKNVTVDDMTFTKTFNEDDVLHLRLNWVNMTPVIDGLYKSYYRMMDAAVRAYQWGHGQHWKVHINQVSAGDKKFAETFADMVQDQIKPFLESNGAILPEFDGYTYTKEAGGYTGDTRDIKAMVEDIFEFTCRAMLIPPVLVNGKVEAAGDANGRFMSFVLDPLCDQLQEEANRKIYGFEGWQQGNYMQIDSSSIIHFDLFGAAASIEKLVGSAAFTINDIRRAAGQVPINEDWANKHWMTRNIGSVDQQAVALDNQKGG